MRDARSFPPGFRGPPGLYHPVPPPFHGAPPFIAKPLLHEGPLQIHRTLEESSAARKVDMGVLRPPGQFIGNLLRHGHGRPLTGVFPVDSLQPDLAGGPLVPRGHAGNQIMPGHRGPGPKWRNNTYKKKRKRTDGGGNNGGPLKVRGNWEGRKFRPPRLQDLRRQNRQNAESYFHSSKKFRKEPQPASVPEAPRNTTSFIMRANKLGINAPVVSPALPISSPSPWASGTAGEQLVEEALELRVDPYGSMNGCIRLKSPDLGSSGGSDKDGSSGESHGTTSSDSVEQVHQVDSHQEVASRPEQGEEREERKEHGWHNFEMLYSPERSDGEGKNGNRFLRARIEEQETEIAHLQEENMTLRERIFLLEQEMKETKRRAREVSDENEEVDGVWSAADEASCAAAS